MSSLQVTLTLCVTITKAYFWNISASTVHIITTFSTESSPPVQDKCKHTCYCYISVKSEKYLLETIFNSNVSIRKNEQFSTFMMTYMYYANNMYYPNNVAKLCIEMLQLFCHGLKWNVVPHWMTDFFTQQLKCWKSDFLDSAVYYYFTCTSTCELVTSKPTHFTDRPVFQTTFHL